MYYKNSISKRFLKLITFLMVLLTVGIFIFTKIKIISSAEKIEEKGVIATTARTEKLVKTSAEAILAVVADYSAWNDTREVVLDNSLAEEYFATNFISDSFKTFNLNFVCLYDNNLKQIYGRKEEDNLLNNKFTFDLSQLYKSGITVYYCNLDEEKQTITRFVLGDVTNTQGDPKAQVGYLILGQNLKLENLIGDINNKDFTAKIFRFEEIVQNNKPYFIRTRDKKIISYFPIGYLNNADNYFLIEIIQNRDLYFEIFWDAIALLVGVCTVFVFLLILIELFLDKLVFKRVDEINKEAETITFDNPQLIKIGSSEDEIGALRNNLNEMLKKIKEGITTKKKVEGELRQAIALWRIFLDSSEDPFWIKDIDGRYMAVNKGYLKNEGIAEKEEEILGKCDFDFYPRKEALEYLRTDELAKQKGGFESETPSIINKDHTYLTKKIPVYDEGQYIGIIGIARDITELKNKERKLLRKEKMLEDTAKLQQDLISQKGKKDIYNILMENIIASFSPDRIQIFEDITDQFSGDGYMQRFTQIGVDASIPLYLNEEFFNNIPYSDKVFGKWLPRLRRGEAIISKTVELPQAEKEIIEKYGIKSMVILPFFVNKELFGHLSVEALTPRDWLEEELSFLKMAGNTLSLALEKYMVLKDLEISNFHDGLTGLYNRKFYEEEVKRIFSNKRNYPISLIMGDLDGLKMTNDTLGHIKGDEMITNAAQCLAKIFRKDDAVARIGGDEFAVVLSNTSEEKVKLIYQRILDENKKMNKELEVPFNISLGYATQNHPEDVFERVYKEADNLMYSNKLKNDQSSKNNMISSLLLVLTSKDSTSETHLSVTSEIIEKFAKFLGIKDKKIEELKLFAKFHDIGKAGVPDAILLKKEKLTLEEFEEIKRHSEIGYKLTKFVPYLAFAAEWILRHHERWDGGGYPGKLVGEEIPLESRIMAIVDSYEAMTSGNRTYRQTKTKPEAIEEIKACSGTQFDPGLTASFIKFLETSLN